MKHSALRDAWTGGSGENKTLFSQQKIYIQFTSCTSFSFNVHFPRTVPYGYGTDKNQHNEKNTPHQN
jgi:hypothetical protein